MSVAKSFLLSLMVVTSHAAWAHDSYRTRYGDDYWSSMLLIETCPDELTRAVSEIFNLVFSGEEGIVAILPEELGYQYFHIEFKKLVDDEIKDLERPFIYMFEYWTYKDRHRTCTKVEPYSLWVQR